MKKRLNWLCVLLTGLALSASVSWAWDGDWTEAQSGRGDIFDDPDSSQGKAGTDPPQKYYTPIPRDFVDVDPEELDDYFDRYKKEYAPYALARIFQDLHYNNQVIRKGYYLIKPGDVNDGSPRINMKTLNPVPAGQPTVQAGYQVAQFDPLVEADQPATLQTPIGEPPAEMPATPQRSKATPDPAATPPTVNPNDPVYRVFVLKRQGKVMAVVPIHRMETYKPPRKENIPKHALAWIEMEGRHPVLKFYYKKRVYCTDFQ